MNQYPNQPPQSQDGYYSGPSGAAQNQPPTPPFDSPQGQYGMPPYGQAFYGAPYGTQSTYMGNGPMLQTPRGLFTLASFGARFAACLIDSLVVMAVTVICVILALRLGEPQAIYSYNARHVRYLSDFHFANPGLFAILIVLAIVGPTIYYTWMTSWSGATLGKMAMGIRVITAGGDTPGVGKSLARCLVSNMVSGSICYLGYLWMLWDPRRQTWHDKICDTFVIKA